MRHLHRSISLAAAGLILLTLGCSQQRALKGVASSDTAVLTPRASTYRDLIALPKPRGKIVATVYNFRDQTGQYKSLPASNFSTAVTQGAASMLVSAAN